MTRTFEEFETDPRPEETLAIYFTPAQWRALLDDDAFLRERANSYRPRRFMGRPVEIVPDPRFG